MSTGEREAAGYGAASAIVSERAHGRLSSDRSPFILRRPWFLFRWLLLLVLLMGACLRDGPGVETYRTRQAAAPFTFSLLDWEVGQVSSRLGDLAQALRGERPPAGETDVATITTYFQAAPAARVSMRPDAERAIQRLVTDAWRAENLESPSVLAGGSSVLFPPVAFTFTAPPQVLIVSPRDRIEVAQYVLLQPDLSPDQIQLLEDGVARRGYSTIVTPIGGLATYPAMVLETGSAASTLAAVAHEWVHAYFFFHPLGRGYWSDQEVRTINETAAELAGNELGNRLAQQIRLPLSTPPRASNPRQSEFNTLLRQTRLEVDHLLAFGNVVEAEQYMEQARLELNARGHVIRRLNQAYFAFYGSYAESAAGSSPVAGQVRRLRDRSASLGEFLQTVAEVGTPADLARLAG
jgi:hypothetical protein